MCLCHPHYNKCYPVYFFCAGNSVSTTEKQLTKEIVSLVGFHYQTSDGEYIMVKAFTLMCFTNLSG